jgi:hypothetical protein
MVRSASGAVQRDRARMTGSLMSRTNPAAGLADARQPFRNKETIMFNRLALALLAATLISAPVMAQAPAAPSSAPAAADTRQAG